MSNMLEPPAPAAPRALPGMTHWLWVALAVLGVLVIFTMYAQFAAVGSLTRQFDEVGKNVATLESRATALEGRYTTASARLAEMAAKSGQTEEALGQARAVIDQNRRDHRQLVARLGGHVEDQEKQFGSLTGEVGAVKAEVAGDRRELQRAMGDLGEQSGLIARNRDELEALKRRGERDYFEFTLAGSEAFTRVGPLSLRLNKTDYRRQKFTLTVLADDKQIEKKDRTLLEPVQFYVPGTRSLREIVVYEVGEGRVVGYVSMPKEVVALK
jgi:septal ring factor EnvC (AmiA/AmiB activator)